MKPMNKLLLVGGAALALMLPAATSIRAQSAYYQAVTNLNPALYIPLQETTPPPMGDVETNYGSLGPIANAVYSSAALTKGAAGATADGDAAVSDSDAAGGFLAVPTTDSRTAVQSPAFTVEVWVNSAVQTRAYEGIVAKAGGNAAGINAANNIAGWCLSQNYIAYLDSQNLRGFDFHVYSGVGHEGAEVIVPYNIVNNTWYHLVATFDGTNCKLYVNGVDMIAARIGYQIPMIGSYYPDTWNELQIGSSRNLNGNNYQGMLDEVAIYTNVLSPSRILAHYAAASSASPYSSTILADQPYMYWRMDAPTYAAPSPGMYPPATAYGQFATSFAPSYGTATLPGVTGPQFPGLLDPNNGNASYAVAINGIGGNNGNIANVVIQTNVLSFTNVTIADAVPVILAPVDTNAAVLNPTNHNPFSASIWFKGNPGDWARTECIMGGTDNGWRAFINPAGTIGFRPGNNGTQIASDYNFNDGNWHHLVCTFDGVSVENLYVDGRLSVTSSGNNVVETGSPLDFLLGGSPQYLSGGNAVPTYITENSGYAQRNLSGNIAHFAFFTNVLSATQVTYLYTNAVPNQVPYILSQPTSGRVNPTPTNSLFFAVVANGSTPLTYQWYFNTSSNYAGATPLANGLKYNLVTTSQVTVSNLASTDSGYYYCIIGNSSGSVTSILASLSVNYAPVITAQSPAASFSVFSGQQATLSVTAISEITPLFYQWYVNGVGDPAGTNALYTSASITTAGTSFYCIVTNTAGSATSVPVSVATVMALPSGLTNSPFSSNILALAPTAYWPMHETGETPTVADVETNYGSVGFAANATWGDWRDTELAAMGIAQGGNENAPTNISVIHQIPGAIAGDPDSAVDLMGVNNSWTAAPRTSPNTTISAPFTIEAWVRPHTDANYGIIVGEDSSTFNTNTYRGGFDWEYSQTLNEFSITLYNGNGAGSAQIKTTASYPPGQWYHVVTTFDGTNVQYYVNGVADSMSTATAATMRPNTWDPLTIGCGRGWNNNYFQGSIDEVAIYTNILTLTDIQKHYNDGTNAAYAGYKGDVLADNPLLYYRMDSPAFTPPPISTWPVLTNYGSVAINGVYSPGAVPGGGNGPSASGVPVSGLSANTALVGDGDSMFADAGYVPQFSPTGKTPFSVAAWAKGNPADVAARGWQSLVGHGDSAWRLVLDGNASGASGGSGNANFNAGPGGGSDIGNTSPALTINDGQWHWVVGTFDGTNSIVYVDGVVSATASNTTANITSQAVDVFLGAYPQNTVYTSTQRSVAQEVGRGLAGSMCEAAFWNGKVLSPSQIGIVYQPLNVAAHILRQPFPSVALNQGLNYTNSAFLGAGSGPLTYQWYENGTNMPGLTNATLILTNIQAGASSTNWYAVVSNGYGSATSTPVSITVYSQPTFTQNITTTNVTLYVGGHVGWPLAAVGAVPLHFQWYSNGVAILNANNTSFGLTNAAPIGTNTYYCLVTNIAGSISTPVVTVAIVPVTAVIPYTLAVLSNNPVGFWPLNEPHNSAGDNGIIANDCWGGNPGIYTNVLLGVPGFNPTIDPNATAVSVGSSVLANSDVFNIPTNVDFSSPSNSSFTIMAWVQGGSASTDAGLVSKGTGGGEQFSLDCGSDTITTANPFSHSYRFFVRDAAGNSHAVTSTVNPDDGLWHHLAGVCDESNAVVTLYIDGLPIGTTSIATNAGILATPASMLIGSRPSGTTPNDNDFQYDGVIQDVAVWNKALTAAQILALYEFADVPPTVTVTPSSITVGQNGNAAFTAMAQGTPVIAYQWYDVNNASLPMPGQTNSTLVITNAQASDQYYVQVKNAFGTNDTSSSPATLNVIAGAPQIYVQPATSTFAPDGSAFAISVTAYGTLPLSYYWQVSDTNEVTWTNLVDNGRITGSSSNVLRIISRESDAGAYQVIVSNSFGSVVSSVSTVIIGTLPISFDTDLTGWGTNGSTRLTGNNTISLTDPANGGGNGTIWYSYPLYIGAFEASFTYQDIGGNGADGFSFCLQNDPRGTAVWSAGNGGGDLAVFGITPSFELEYNIYAPSSPSQAGYSVNTNGIIGASIPPTPVNFDLGNPINIALLYANGHLSITFTDTVAHVTFNTNLNVGDLTKVLNGQTAYVGFTGSMGGVQSHQQISNFSFVSLATEGIQITGTNVVVSYPSAIGGYVVQQNSNLATSNWTTLTNMPSAANGLYQLTLPMSNTNEFYRLILQP
jgi:hypothetical protein